MTKAYVVVKMFQAVVHEVKVFLDEDKANKELRKYIEENVKPEDEEEYGTTNAMEGAEIDGSDVYIAELYGKNKIDINKLKEKIDESLEFHGCSRLVRGIIKQLIESFENE